jgi:hypothetical protein
LGGWRFDVQSAIVRSARHWSAIEALEEVMLSTIEQQRVDACVKSRRPSTVAVLSVATFGIYSIVWYYKINREMRDFGASYDERALAATKPWLAVLAITFGRLLVIPGLISVVRTVRRVQAVERIAWDAARPSGAVISLFVAASLLPLGASVHKVGGLLALGGFGAFVAALTLVQGRLNAAWRAAGAAPVPVLGPWR